MLDRPHGHLRLRKRASTLNRTKPTLDSRRFRVAEVALAVVRRTRYPLIPEMEEELVEVLHHFLDVRPYRCRQVLDLVEHCLEPSESRYIRWSSEHALELAPDDRGVKFLRVRMTDAPEHGVPELLLGISEEMEVASMMERVEVVLNDLGVFVATVGGDHVGWFVVENFREKITDGVLSEPVGDAFADRRIQQIVVEHESVRALAVDAEILFVVGVDPRILREIVLDDLPRVFGDPVAELLVGRTETEVDGADVLEVFE